MTMSTVILDPEVEKVVDALSNMSNANLEDLPLQEALKIARPTMPTPAPPDGCEDIRIPAMDGVDLRARLYLPPVPSPDAPIVLHLHGGGFVSGSIELDDARCQIFARDVNCYVLSLDYRLAPEHKFPTAVEDAFAAWKWIEENAGVKGWNASNAAVSGSSAGGHIAIGLVELVKENRCIAPVFQLLTYPVINPEMNTASYQEFTDGPFLTKQRMSWYWDQYRSPCATANPALWHPGSKSVTDHPPAYVITAEYDPLRDEGESYGESLLAAGIPCKVERFDNMIHGFISILPHHDSSQKALATSVSELKKAFS